jgi:hypothetical protein
VLVGVLVGVLCGVLMAQLLFKKCFVEAIRCGIKTTTLRRWASPPRARAGQRVFSPGVGWLRVEAVEWLANLDRLTDADARADGFENVAAMKRALRRIYPDAGAGGDGDGADGGVSGVGGDGRSWFKVTFQLAPADAELTADPTAEPTTDLTADLTADLLRALNAALIRRYPAAATSSGDRPRGASC